MNDLPVGRSVDETLRLVQAFQYTDTHGEVCPAGWKPGSDTVSYTGFNPIALRKAKIAYNFGLSECSRVKVKILKFSIHTTVTVITIKVEHFSFRMQ